MVQLETPADEDRAVSGALASWLGELLHASLSLGEDGSGWQRVFGLSAERCLY